jgi:NTP pyrophosphatase (non-canonical NTP hydrolase)
MKMVQAKGGLETRTKIINDINLERSRQDYLHPEKLPLAMRFITIMEESGEVAEALQDRDTRGIYRELIDMAASCVRMAEEVLEE